MRLPSGQPLLQKGMPQSMHRAAWVCRWSSGKGSYTSFQSRRRTGTGRRVGVWRGYFMKPVTSPMRGRHDRLVHGKTLLLGDAGRLEDPLVVGGHDLLEPTDLGVPAVEHPLGHGR